MFRMMAREPSGVLHDGANRQALSGVAPSGASPGGSRASQPAGVLSMDEIGRKRWAIAEGYIPSESVSSDRALLSHETACILNAGDRDANVALTIYFADREPAGPYRVVVP